MTITKTLEAFQTSWIPPGQTGAPVCKKGEGIEGCELLHEKLNHVTQSPLQGDVIRLLLPRELPLLTLEVNIVKRKTKKSQTKRSEHLKRKVKLSAFLFHGELDMSAQ